MGRMASNQRLEEWENNSLLDSAIVSKDKKVPTIGIYVLGMFKNIIRK